MRPSSSRAVPRANRDPRRARRQADAALAHRASLAWLLFDFVYYGNTISSPVIVKLVSPHASLTGQTAIVLAIFAVAALPGFILAAFTIDTIGRKLLQAVGFAVMAAAFACLWLVPGAATTLLPFLLLFGATYFFSEFGPNTTTFVYPAEIFPFWLLCA